MAKDIWNSYTAFKAGQTETAKYYDLVRRAFEMGVERLCAGTKVASAIDLGCGSAELTRRLRMCADKVVGVDASPGLIERARSEPDQKALEFIQADVLDNDAMSSFASGTFDLVTAAWLHNHLSTHENQRQLYATIVRLMSPQGGFVFLIPSDAFTSRQIQHFTAQLDWRQAWLEEAHEWTKGVYSFAGSAWQEMTVWRPMRLAKFYEAEFDLEFLDVKTLCLAHEGLGDPPVEPPFEVLLGRRKRPKE